MAYSNPITAAVLAIAIAPALLAQTTKNLPAAPAPTADSKYIFQTQAPLVVLDVVVTDNSGNPVHNLKTSDFTVLENGQPMQVDSFEEHRTDQAATTAPPKPLHLGPNVFTNYTPTPTDGPLNILLLDSLNTQATDQNNIRKQMLEYLKKIPPGTHMAVFGLTDHLMLLQGFTTDPALLKTVLANPKGIHQIASLLPTLAEKNVDTESNYDLHEIDQLLGDPMAEVLIANLDQFTANVNTDKVSNRVLTTLLAMDELARYLSGFPGRKNLIWFSSSFPLNIMPDIEANETASGSTFFAHAANSPGINNNYFSPQANYGAQVKATDDLLARSQVAVYPIDGRGLFLDPAHDVQNNDNANNALMNLAHSPSALVKSNQQFTESTSQEHSTMQLMADQTGGKAFYDDNGLRESVADAINNGANYYTLTYKPRNQDWDGSFRKLKVDLDRQHLKLAYRRGYYADDPQKPQHADNLPVSAMQIAMRPGGPNPMQVLFTAEAEATTATEDALPPSNHASDKSMQPPYRRYTLHYADDVHNLDITATPDGINHAHVEVSAILYDADGHPLNYAVSSLRFSLSPANYATILKTGLRLDQQIDAPATGEYFLRLGLHDLGNDHIGTVEIPLSRIKLSQPRPPELKTLGDQKPIQPSK